MTIQFLISRTAGDVGPYRIGDTITVMLEEVDVIRGKLGFSIAEEK